MRVAIISAHYIPEVGYQEVHLAKAYARLGFQVKVFTSCATINLGKNIGNVLYKKGISKDDKYHFEILRLPSVYYKSKVIPFGLKKEVDQFNPTVIIILGVAKIFPISLFNKHTQAKYKIASVYGDAKEYLDRGTIKQKIKTFLHEIGYHVIKYPLYKKAITYGDKLILNIPETNLLFNQFLNEKQIVEFNVKKMMLNLGYDPEVYFYNSDDRVIGRKKIGVENDEIVFITSTRVNARKNLEQVIERISELHKQGYKINYVIIGFLEDSYEKELKIFISKQHSPTSFKCFPFLNADEIRKLYCAADVGIWLKAAISIQEAMGTGLPVLLENKPSVNHLVEKDLNGWLFQNNEFDFIFKKIADNLKVKSTNREIIAKHNAKKLSYDAIAKKIINSLIPNTIDEI